MTENSKHFENSLKELKSFYLVKIKEEITYFDKILKTTITKEMLEDLQAKVHKLSGSAGMYGFAELSSITHEFDLELQEILKKDFNLYVDDIKDKICGIINIMDVL